MGLEGLQQLGILPPTATVDDAKRFSTLQLALFAVSLKLKLHGAMKNSFNRLWYVCVCVCVCMCVCVCFGSICSGALDRSSSRHGRARTYSTDAEICLISIFGPDTPSIGGVAHV